jgi:hypothetical protein
MSGHHSDRAADHERRLHAIESKLSEIATTVRIVLAIVAFIAGIGGSVLAAYIIIQLPG